MTNQITISELPRAVRGFIEAVNRSDGERAIAAFAGDALVNDIRREFSGVAAIRAWLEREIIGDSVRLEILEARAQYETTIVTARATGDFDKSDLPDPLDLTLYFTTTTTSTSSSSTDAITQLVVIANQPTPDWASSEPGRP
jgi:hypothetical protein